MVVLYCNRSWKTPKCDKNRFCSMTHSAAPYIPQRHLWSVTEQPYSKMESLLNMYITWYMLHISCVFFNFTLCAHSLALGKQRFFFLGDSCICRSFVISNAQANKLGKYNSFDFCWQDSSWGHFSMVILSLKCLVAG